MSRYCLLIFWLCFFSSALADTFYTFDSAEHERRFNQLNTELRCLVCQNQSLADSDAELAQDLRQIVYNMIQTGETDQAIRDYMVARYGQYVLYKPRLSPATYLLWFGPALFLLLGVAGLIGYIRQQRQQPVDTQAVQLDAAEQAALARHLGQAGHPDQADLQDKTS